MGIYATLLIHIPYPDWDNDYCAPIFSRIPLVQPLLCFLNGHGGYSINNDIPEAWPGRGRPIAVLLTANYKSFTEGYGICINGEDSGGFDELKDIIEKIEWVYPEDVQVFIMFDEDSAFRVYTMKNRKLSRDI